MSFTLVRWPDIDSAVKKEGGGEEERGGRKNFIPGTELALKLSKEERKQLHKHSKSSHPFITAIQL